MSEPIETDPLTSAERATLEGRAARLAASGGAAVEEATLAVAELPVGDDTFAIPLESLRGAVPLNQVTPVPLSASHVIGVLRFQGQVISALSLAALLGGRGWGSDPTVLVVVDPGWGRLVALDCEQIPKAGTLPQAAVDAARAAGAGPICAVAAGPRKVVQLIDLALLLERRTGGRASGD